ncbi:MAG: hypothetical protein KF869_05605 [Phycisphaeraceae bacterium]|nr:hypothetical protein [Phycisphaeraceae bacterium]
MRSSSLVRRFVVATACASTLMAAAAAQPVPGAAAQKPPADDPIALGIAARSVARLATADLKLQSDPESRRAPIERDYRIAAELLTVASETDPDDQDILRLLIQAWTAAGDADRVEQLQRRLAMLDPSDTVTLLAVVSSRISKLQNVEERLAAYTRMLGPEGDRLDPSIRSRLALDAALLSRERGDDEAFVRLLARASALDSTNKDAATLALAYFAERVPDAVGRLELLFNVLKADPFDPDVHAAIAQELGNAGAVNAASRFYQTLTALRGARGQELSPQEHAEAFVSSWNVAGAYAVVARMNNELEDSRERLRSRKAKAEAAGQMIDRIADPSDARLPVPLERARVVASAATADPELVGYAVAEAVETFRRSLESITDPQKRPEEMTDEQAEGLARSIRTERAWLVLWAGRGTERVAEWIDELRQDPGADPLVIRRLDAFAAMRAGEHDRAAAELSALARQDPLAMMGLGILAESRGQGDAAIKVYSTLATQLAGSLAGAYCRTRHADIAGVQVPATELARRMQQLSDEVPSTLEAMIADPRRFMDMSVVPVKDEMSLTDKVALRFTIQNTSPFALAVGPEKPINSRFLLAPMVDLGVQRMRVPNLHEIMYLNRRLRILPGERMEATVWADSGLLGGILQRVASEPVRMRWRVVQGFRMNQRGFFDPGPMCLSTEAGPVARPASFRASADIPSFVGWIESGTPRELAEALLALREKLSSREHASTVSQLDVDLLARSCVNRFASGSRAEKLIILAFTPSGMQTPAFQPLDAAALADGDEHILRFMLTVRVGRADSPVLADDAWPGRPELSDLARLLRERLREGVRTLATIAIRELAEEAPAPGDAPAGR